MTDSSGPSLTARLPASSTAAAVEFSLACGQCLVVTGPSGVGKTTMLRKLADLDPHEGSVLFDGRSQQDMPGPVWRRQVSYVSSDAGWWAPTVRDHFDPAHSPVELMERIGLAVDKLDSPPQQLSTGERQRMALVRALVRGPKFLLLDEPTSALDDATTREVEALLQEAKNAGCGMVVVTHDTAQGARLADQQLALRRAQ
jgi:ABC-type iron transport system FetAB ATPase subunit